MSAPIYNTKMNYEDLKFGMKIIQNGIITMKNNQENIHNIVFLEDHSKHVKQCPANNPLNHGNLYRPANDNHRREQRRYRIVRPYLEVRHEEQAPNHDGHVQHRIMAGRGTRINYTIQDTIHCEDCLEDIQLEFSTYPQALQTHMIERGHVMQIIPTRNHQSRWHNIGTRFKCLKCNYETGSFKEFICHISEEVGIHNIQQTDRVQDIDNIIIVEDDDIIIVED